MFSDGNVTAAGNQCRNPGGVRARPWCFTSDPDVIWQYCAIPLCGACVDCFFLNSHQLTVDNYYLHLRPPVPLSLLALLRDCSSAVI